MLKLATSRRQRTQSAGPVRFLKFCSISISLLASLVAGRKTQCSAGSDQQGMYSTIPIHWNITSAPASPGRSRVGPVLYVNSLLALADSEAQRLSVHHIVAEARRQLDKAMVLYNYRAKSNQVTVVINSAIKTKYFFDYLKQIL